MEANSGITDKGFIYNISKKRQYMYTIKGDDGSKYVEVDVDHIHDTEDAILLSNGVKKAWFPKAVMEDWPARGESGTAIILLTFAIEKGFV